MIKIENLVVSLEEEKKEIIHGLSLEIKPGEIHLLNGNNGSGKSTLVNTIMGNPAFKINSGSIKLTNNSISEFIKSKIDPDYISGDTFEISSMEPTERSLAGLFLATQYPVEIPGVALTSYLRLIYNSRRPKEEQMPVFKFKRFLDERADIINYPKHLLSRNLNEGFSGGEKKKTEILQMLVLEPKYIFLDEVDSGLDRTSVKEVFGGLAKFKETLPETALVIITHYDKVQEYLKPDFVHEMSNGKLLS